MTDDGLNYQGGTFKKKAVASREPAAQSVEQVPPSPHIKSLLADKCERALEDIESIMGGRNGLSILMRAWIRELSTVDDGPPALAHAQQPDAAGAVEAKHELYRDSDKNKPKQILDRNGKVVLDLCKRCGRAEIELDSPCTPALEAKEVEHQRALLIAYNNGYKACKEDRAAPEAKGEREAFEAWVRDDLKLSSTWLEYTNRDATAYTARSVEDLWRCWQARAALEAKGASPAVPEDVALLTWAVNRWRDEVENRPLHNIHRRSLDDAWRQVIRYAGGNPLDLIGPAHDALAAAPSAPDGKETPRG